MTAKENLLAVLDGGDPEWMPVCLHITNANNLPGFLPQELLTEPLDTLAVSAFVGGDLLHEFDAVRGRVADGFGWTQCCEGMSRHATLSTPRGALTQTVLYAHAPTPHYAPLPPGYALPGPLVTSNHTDRFIKRVADYDILRRSCDAQTFTADHGRVARELARVGERGVGILGGGPPSPLYGLVAEYAGIERVCYDLCDAPREVDAAMAAMQAAACRWYEAAAETDCPWIRCTEDLDTKLISPELFRRYAAPALAAYARICHARGKRFVVHDCGHIRDLLPDFRAAGVDAIHCLTLPPTGNTTAAEARAALVPTTAAMIRMDPHVLLTGSEAAIDEWVDALAAQLGDWRQALVIVPCGRASLWSIRRLIERVHRLKKTIDGYCR